MHLVTKPNYVPREQGSCSSVKLSLKCERAWHYRYVLGIDEPDVDWNICKHWTKPKPRIATKPTPLEKEAVKYFNRTRRRALGKAAHTILELWAESFRGGPGVAPEQWHDLPGRIVTAGLGLIPHPSTLLDWWVERKGADDFAKRVIGRELEFNMYLDLVTVDKHTAKMRVIDYKSTSSTDWIKKPEELQDDPQGICYPLDVMLRYDLDEIECRWIYFLTEGPPKARAVDFLVTRKEALRRALPIVNRADELINSMRLRLTADETPANTAACDQYGGCIYHTSRGGPCTARPSWGKILRARHARTKTEEDKLIMGFRKNAQAAGVIGGGAAAPKTTSTEAAGAEQPAGQSEQADAPAGTEQGAADAATGTARRGGARRRSAAVTEGGPIHLAFENGAQIELPPTSPLYSQAVAIFNAFHPEG